MMILALPLGLALGVTVWSPSATLSSAPALAAQLWQKPETAARGAQAGDGDGADSGGPKTPKDPKDSKNPKDAKGSPKAAKATARPAATTTTARTTTAPVKKRRALSDKAKSTETLEAEVFGESPTVRRKPARHHAHALRKGDDADDDTESGDDAGDDSEDDSDGDDGGGWTASLPVIAPRLVSLGVASAFIGRSFHFDAPLQPESTFPRAGVAVDLEAFPLSGMHGRGVPSWLGGLGLGGSFANEFGSAGIDQTDGGRLSYPITERRWEASLRWAVPLGERFVAVPMIGFGHQTYEVQRRTEVAPSACGGAATQVCLPDVHLSHLALGASARVAFSPSIGLSLTGAYLVGFGLGKETGELGSEAASSSARGLSGELALAWQVNDWLAIRAAAPLLRWSYAFSGAALPYHAATETYYGGLLGATVFTR